MAWASSRKTRREAGRPADSSSHRTVPYEVSATMLSVSTRFHGANGLAGKGGSKRARSICGRKI